MLLFVLSPLLNLEQKWCFFSYLAICTWSCLKSQYDSPLFFSPSNCGFAWLGFEWIFCMVSSGTAAQSCSIHIIICHINIVVKASSLCNRQKRGPWRESGGKSETSSLLRRAGRRRRCTLMDWKTGEMKRPKLVNEMSWWTNNWFIS